MLKSIKKCVADVIKNEKNNDNISNQREDFHVIISVYQKGIF